MEHMVQTTLAANAINRYEKEGRQAQWKHMHDGEVVIDTTNSCGVRDKDADEAEVMKDGEGSVQKKTQYA